MALQPAVHRAGGSSEMSVGAGDAGASEAANRMAITPERSPSPRVLVAFDFDHTVVDANSDTWVHRCLPGGQLPEEISLRYVQGRWTAFMNDVLGYAAACGVPRAEMEAVMRAVPLAPGMPALLAWLGARSADYECVIISDANSVFIEWILDEHGFSGLFRGRVYTNPGWWDTAGQLRVEHHHAHGCATCHVNLCKREVLEGLLAARAAMGTPPPAAVLYVGDGSNDVCPAVSLRAQDTVFPRTGYPLAKALRKQAAAGTPGGRPPPTDRGGGRDGPECGDHRYSVVARVVEWDDARTIAEWIEANVDSAQHLQGPAIPHD